MIKLLTSYHKSAKICLQRKFQEVLKVITITFRDNLQDSNGSNRELLI